MPLAGGRQKGGHRVGVAKVLLHVDGLRWQRRGGHASVRRVGLEAEPAARAKQPFRGARPPARLRLLLWRPLRAPVLPIRLPRA